MPQNFSLIALIIAALMALPVIAGALAIFFTSRRREYKADAKEEDASDSDDFYPDPFPGHPRRKVDL